MCKNVWLGSRCGFVAILVGVFLLSSPFRAVAWYDDFNDGSVDDGNPVTWTYNEVGFTPGIYDASSGDFRLSAPGGPTGDDDNLAASVAVSFGDVFVRTQAVVAPGPNPGETGGNVGLALRYDPFTFSGYSVLIDDNGVYNIVNVLFGNITFLATGTVAELGASTDLMLEFQAVGTELSFYAWRPDQPRPSTPLATVTDSDFTSGRAGISYNEDDDNTVGVFRFAAAQGTPFEGPCDFNGDLLCDITDMDLLTLEVSSGGTRAIFDLTSDGSVNLADMNAWRSLAGVQNLGPGKAYLVGDANLDGVVDGTDFNAWNASKFSATGRWSQGDFNADGNTDGSDFGLWNSNKFTSADAAAVPEPASIGLVWVAIGFWYHVIGQRSRSVA